MKHLSITFLLLAGILVHMQAQLTVADDNNVGIAESSPVSLLSVNGTGNTSSTLYVENATLSGYQRAAHFYKSASSDNGGAYSFAMNVRIDLYGGNKLVGGNFSAYTSGTATSNKTFGIRAVAGNGYNGMNYGVYSYLYEDRYGAAILGTTSGSEPVLSEKYAGYFVGNVHTVGNITYSGTCSQSSDTRLKKNIRPLISQESSQMDKLKTLSAIKYNMKNPAELNLFDPAVIDTMKVDPRTIAYTEDIYTRERIGLSAQEVQAVYPELVHENNDGFLSLNYTGLVPVLIEAIKEQETTIKALSQTVQSFETSQQAQLETLQTHESSIQSQAETLQTQADSIQTQAAAIQILEDARQAQDQTIQALNEASRSQAEDIKVLKEEIDKLKNARTTE